MTTPVITAADIVATVRDLAHQRPDARITGDDRMVRVPYIHNGQPFGLIGAAVASVALIDDSLERDWCVNYFAVDELLDHLLVESAPEDLLFLQWVKHYEDRRDSWSSAVSKADECMARDVPWSLRGEVA